MGVKEIAETVNGEIGVNDAHHGTDEKQQQQNLDAVVNKEVERGAELCFGTQTYQAVNQPICKVLNHKK